MFIRTDIGKTFGVELIQSSEMNAALTLWDNITSGRPPWLDPDDDVRTYNMGKHISDYRARLVCLDLGVALSGSPRADYLQTICNDLIKRLPDKVADAERLGGIAIKWNGSSWDLPCRASLASPSRTATATSWALSSRSTSPTASTITPGWNTTGSKMACIW